MNKAEQAGLLNGLQFDPSGLSIHHLIFADDSLFLCKAEVSQCFIIQNILVTYEGVTGQTINLAKSAITFGAKIDQEVREEIQTKLAIFNEGGVGTYLGLPEYFGGSKKNMLAFIQDNLKSRLTGWYAN